MNRIDQCLEQLSLCGTKALIPYLPVGFPHPSQTLAIMHGLVRGGANIIELGVPFSDPMADGPVIQKATDQALSFGVSLKTVLNTVKEFRADNPNTPIVIMTYTNPIESMGYEIFAAQAAEVGVDAVLMVDSPIEELAEVKTIFTSHSLYLINFLSSTTRQDRLDKVCQSAQGFVYYVALKGVTGAANLDATEVTSHVLRIKKQLQTPLMIGFGVRDGASARAVAQSADGVIIGTELVKQLGEDYRTSTGSDLVDDKHPLICASEVAPELVASRAEVFLKQIRYALDQDDHKSEQ